MHPDLATRKGFTHALESIRGVKSAQLDMTMRDQVLVTIRYKLWTYLWFGLKKKASTQVKDFIYEHRPMHISMGCKVNSDGTVI